MNRNLTLIGLAVLIVSGFAAVPFAASAAYDPNDVITDYELVRQSMSRSQIQSFLQYKGSCLKSYSYGGHSAAWLIYNYGAAYSINPQIVLATLQKEQSLVTSGSCSSNALAWAMGWGTRSNFGDQIKYGTRQFRKYYDNPQNYNFQKGETTRTADGADVTPANKATAGQFNYTPYRGDCVTIGGVCLFNKIWNEWFAANMPEGRIVKKSGVPRYYRILPGKKMQPIKSYVIAASYVDTDNIAEMSSAQLGAYALSGGWLPLPDGVPILAPWGTFYVIENGMRRGVPDPATRERMGYRTEDALKVDSGVVVQHPEGKPFSSSKLYVNGSMLRAEGEQGVWYINETSKKRYGFWSPGLRDHYSISHTVVEVPRSTIDQYRYIASNPLKYRPGNLVGLNGAVFFIDYYGNRRPITSRETFDALGFDMNAVHWENKDVVNLHPLGSAL